MWKQIKDFFKKNIFFRIDNEEKEAIRVRVMENDHKVYKILLPMIMFVEAVMLIMSFIEYGANPVSDSASYAARGINFGTVEHIYRGFYAVLILGSFIILLFLEHYYKKRKTFKYFMFVCFFLMLIMFWGSSVSILDSYLIGYNNPTYFAVALIATSATLTLEPWVAISASLLAVVLYDVAYFCIPPLNAVPTVDFFMTTAVIVALAIIAATFNFTRRVKAISLEIQVSGTNETLIEKALVDDLTKVYNRRYLTEHIDIPLDYSENGTGIIMLDIDHFKNLNDTYGHQVGDECLSLLGIAINNLIRDKDAYCVRYGGEEFLIYFKNISIEQLKEYAETLRQRIQKMKVSISGGVQLSYTISLGLAKAVDGISYNDLINQADEALYEAKETTRNRVVYYGDISK